MGCEHFSERAKLLTHPRSVKSAEPIKKVHWAFPRHVHRSLVRMEALIQMEPGWT